LYGSKIWSLALKDEHTLGVGRIFVPKREKVTGCWRKLDYEGTHNFHLSPNIIRMIKSKVMRWAGDIARMGEKRNV
jgi:hypothetical protein